MAIVTDFRCGVVIPVGPNREANLRDTLESLEAQTYKPRQIVVVYDGCEPTDTRADIVAVVLPTKHIPGREQPRNIGVRALADDIGLTHVWFVDSDITFNPNALQAFADAAALSDEPRILVGPYDWLGPSGEIERPDDRWQSFNEHPPSEINYNPVGAGTACFSGNLVWPIKEFQEIGGFWSELHHGRCEDGELGIRATSAGIGVSFVKDARGEHHWHPRDMDWTLAANARDVPLINRRHPFMPDSESLDPSMGAKLLMTAKDGIRFDFRCPGCGKRMNSLLYWEHCGGRGWKCPDA